MKLNIILIKKPLFIWPGQARLTPGILWWGFGPNQARPGECPGLRVGDALRTPKLKFTWRNDDQNTKHLRKLQRRRRRVVCPWMVVPLLISQLPEAAKSAIACIMFHRFRLCLFICDPWPIRRVWKRIRLLLSMSPWIKGENLHLCRRWLGFHHGSCLILYAYIILE